MTVLPMKPISPHASRGNVPFERSVVGSQTSASRKHHVIDFRLYLSALANVQNFVR